MRPDSLLLVFGATGGTGKHLVSQALDQGHRVRAIVRSPEKITIQSPKLEILKGSITDASDVDSWVRGSDYVVAMVGDRDTQRTSKICTAFVKQLVPAMRRHNVKRFLYQAGGMTRPYGKDQNFPIILWMLKYTLGWSFAGQHADNEAVAEYLVEDAQDIEWIVHRAAIRGEGPSKGVLKRSPNEESNIGIGTFVDTAAYNLRALDDESAIHTQDTTCFEK